jgi:hypothetical protein
VTETFSVSRYIFLQEAYSSTPKRETAGSSDILATQPRYTRHNHPHAGPTTTLSPPEGSKSSILNVFLSFHFPEMDDLSTEALCVDRYSDEAYY